jgi:hypothetical protein
VLAIYYPVSGRLDTEQHRDDKGQLVEGCSSPLTAPARASRSFTPSRTALPSQLSSPDADVLAFVRSFFPLHGAINYEDHEISLFVIQVTELADIVVFPYNHALSDSSALCDFLNTWAEITCVRLAPLEALGAVTSRAHVRAWSPDGDVAPPIVLLYSNLAWLTKTQSSASRPQLRERMLHFSVGSLMELKERARQELLAARDKAGAAAVTKFQALSSLPWRCVARARETLCRFAINNREQLWLPLPLGYFDNSVYAISTKALSTSELLARGHGWVAVVVGRAVPAHRHRHPRARGGVDGEAGTGFGAAAAAQERYSDRGLPRFDVYGYDFEWGKPLAVRTGKVSLFPRRDGGGGIDVEVALAPEHMAALELDGEFWAAVSPATSRLAGNYFFRPRLKIINRFSFSTYINFIMHLDITIYLQLDITIHSIDYVSRNTKTTNNLGCMEHSIFIQKIKDHQKTFLSWVPHFYRVVSLVISMPVCHDLDVHFCFAYQ